MTQKDNILQELKELRSSLASAGFANVYQVPTGYFDNLAERVLNRVKAMDATDAAEELKYLSPLLSSLSKEMPYSVPADFFNNQDERVRQLMHAENNGLSPDEELKELSPLLSSLKKEMPYTVPVGYFESVGVNGTKEETAPAPVILITRKSWFRYAAAAIVIGFIAISGFLIWGNGKSIDPKTQSAAWVEKNLKKIPTDEINKFVQLADENVSAYATLGPKNEATDKNDVRELIKDIPEKDIQSFLDETQSAEPEANDDVLMN